MAEQKESATLYSNHVETKQIRPKYEEIVSIDIMNGLQEFCDEFSYLVVPPGAEKRQEIKENIDGVEEEESATISMLDSLDNLIAQLSDNLNRSIVRIEELTSARNGLSSSVIACGVNVMDKLEMRIQEMQEIYQEIDVMNELIDIIEAEHIEKYRQRYSEILVLCDENMLIQQQLKQDPIGTIKKQYKKTIKQNAPKIQSEINAQKEKLKQMTHNLQFNAKHALFKLTKNQNIFSFEKPKEKRRNIYVDNEQKEETEEESDDVNDDQIRAIEEYEWNNLPVLSDWNQLIIDAKEQLKYKQNAKPHKSKDNLHQMTIRWLTEEKDNKNKSIVSNDSEEESVSVKSRLSVDLP